MKKYGLEDDKIVNEELVQIGRVETEKMIDVPGTVDERERDEECDRFKFFLSVQLICACEEIWPGR
jgi:hypothetical protein